MNKTESSDGHHCGPPKEYIVTQTLAEHIEAFANIGLEIPDPGFIKDMHLSRLIDFEGNIIGIGPRPYHDLPMQQFADFANEIADRDVILVEDGSFTGSTVLYTLELLKSKRARVRAIVLGIMFPGAEEKIKAVFDGEIVYCKKPENPLDWMPSHDFFPFIPNAGRVIGHRLGKIVMPVYLNYDNAAIAVPYVKPYGNTDWASLPGNYHSLSAFSSFCLHSAEEIFFKMEEKTGKKICVGDVVGSSPVTYIPVCCGGDQTGFSRAGDRVADIISLDRERFA